MSAVASWFASLPVRGKLGWAFGLQLAVLSLGCGATLLVQQEVIAARTWAAHTYQVIDGITQLREAVLAQQSAHRGYVLTAQAPFLERLKTARQAFDRQVATLRPMVADNPAQLARLDALNAVMLDWQDQVLQPSMTWMSDPSTRHLSVELIARGEGQRRVDDMQRYSREMAGVEQVLLGERQERLHRYDLVLRSLILGLLVVGWYAGVRIVNRLNAQLGEPMSELAALVPRLARGEVHAIPGRGREDEIGTLAEAMATLGEASRAQVQRDWVRAKSSELAGALQHCEDEAVLAETLLRRLSENLDAGYALAYRWHEERAQLVWCAAYGLPEEAAMRRVFRLGEGLVGQCMVERRRLEISPVPQGYLQVVSGLGHAHPHSLLLLPLTARGETVGVLEFALLRAVEPRQRELLEQVLAPSAMAWQSLARSLRTRELLEQSRTQADQLQASAEALRVQQEELRATNETLRHRSEQLEKQSRQLKASEEELRAQTEELRITNGALEERSVALRARQQELETARQELERRAEDLSQASRYKSEFLANMSHELRTPLNSMLILSKVLADNEEGTLTGEQVEAAGIVHESGKSLLALINDILDLSKVEAGKMQLSLEDLPLRDLAETLERRFRPLARERRLSFETELDPALPALLRTDATRLLQVLGNLLSNAFKFTHEGGVTLAIRSEGARVVFAVRDSGIGIPADKLARVFQAFEQADSSTSRRYGGTGLGLSIVSGLVRLLGGDIRVQSSEGRGSTFTLALPLDALSAAIVEAPAPAAAMPAPLQVEPLPAPAPPPLLRAGPPALLIVEDDAAFARVLADIATRRGLEVLTAGLGSEALALAQRRELMGVLLDLGLPDMSGWRVLERLKADPATRTVPVHIISAADEASRGLALGAVGFLVKPATREDVLGALDRVASFEQGRRRRLLLVDDDAASRLAVRHLLEHEDVEIVEASNGHAGLAALESPGYDCVILDLGLPDISGFEFLERAAAQGAMPPVVIYSARELTPDENLRLRQHTESIVIKGARSPERLLDEVTLFLHALRKPGGLSSTAPAPHAPVADVAGKTVLVVDDDMRNVFALSKALRARGLQVLMAQDGHKALAQLEANPGIDVVLMDIMMPGMDGFETTRRIRERPEWRELPIIAVTAKAMKGDREKCIEAGANDYCSKPIDVDQLMSLIRVWV